jgi:hypothetical protein
MTSAVEIRVLVRTLRGHLTLRDRKVRFRVLEHVASGQEVVTAFLVVAGEGRRSASLALAQKLLVAGELVCVTRNDSNEFKDKSSVYYRFADDHALLGHSPRSSPTDEPTSVSSSSAGDVSESHPPASDVSSSSNPSANSCTSNPDLASPDVVPSLARLSKRGMCVVLFCTCVCVYVCVRVVSALYVSDLCCVYVYVIVLPPDERPRLG